MDLTNLNSITKDLYDSTPENVVSVGYGKKKKNGIITSENSLVFGVLYLFITVFRILNLIASI